MRRAPWAVGLAVSALVAGCHGKSECIVLPCMGELAPVTLHIACGGEQTPQVTFTGVCAAAELGCVEPADAGSLAGCNAASFTSGPGTCGVTMRFANGFVFTQSFDFEQPPAPDTCSCPGPEMVSPQVVTVPCTPEGGVEAGSEEAGADAGAE